MKLALKERKRAPKHEKYFYHICWTSSRAIHPKEIALPRTFRPRGFTRKMCEKHLYYASPEISVEPHLSRPKNHFYIINRQRRSFRKTDASVIPTTQFIFITIVYFQEHLIFKFSTLFHLAIVRRIRTTTRLSHKP